MLKGLRSNANTVKQQLYNLIYISCRDIQSICQQGEPLILLLKVHPSNILYMTFHTLEEQVILNLKNTKTSVNKI